MKELSGLNAESRPRVSASDRADLLEGAAVNILPVTHLHCNDYKFIVLDTVYNTIRTMAHPVFIVTGQLPGTRRAWIISQLANAIDHALPFFLLRYGFNFIHRRTLD